MSLETNISELNQNIPSAGQHTAALADFGQLALSNLSPAELFARAAALVTQTLPVDLVMLWELEADKKHLSLRGISGGKEPALSLAQIPLEPASLEGFVLVSPYPVVVNDLQTETRFKPMGVLAEYEPMSGVAVRIGTVEKTVGILESFSKQIQTFSQSDIQFLQAMGSILTLFLDSQRPAVHTQFSVSSGYVAWEHDEIKNRLVQSRERERLRLAQELHDTPIQDLYGLMYQLDDLKDLVRDTEGMGIVEEFNQTLRRVVNNLRTICGDLRPPSLSPFGLGVAIRDHVDRLHKQFPEIQFHLELMQDQQELSDSLRLCLFRIYQQAINNVLRHAGATDVYIRFRLRNDFVQLEVEDNGRGFEVPQHWVDLVRQEHFGLVGLAERVESVHGKLEIVSAPGDGALVRILVPRR